MSDSSVPTDATAVEPLCAALLEAFEAVEDPRVERTRLHRLGDILLLALAAFCCGAEGFEDIELWAKLQGVCELRQDLGVGLDNGIPHHDTFRRVFARLEPQALEQSLHLVRKRLPEAPRHIAIDGKELRGSHDAQPGAASGPTPALMLLSAFATDQNLVLAQKRVDTNKTNEIPVAQEVLALVDIEGATVTGDAMHCQRDTATLIRARGGDYLLAVKDNQHTLHTALVGLFQTCPLQGCLPVERARTLEKDHGRIEVREGRLIRVCDWLPDTDPLRLLWKDLTSVLYLECERRWTHRGKPRHSRYVRYFISSSEASVQEHMHFARSHWKVENNLHWVLDVTFREDESRVRKGHEVQNLATLRRLSAHLLSQREARIPRRSIRGRKKAAGWDRAYLLQVLTN